MEFLKAEDLTLNPAGYLVSKGNKPVNNEAFISAQTSAHLFCSIAAACEGKNFVADKVYNFKDIVNKVKVDISTDSIYQYEKAPKKKESILDQIASAGLAFVEFEGKASKAEKVNRLMAEFEAIRKVEQVGEYFTEGVVSLKKLYTIKDLLTAAKIIVEIE